jgi:uncharacterized protein
VQPPTAPHPPFQLSEPLRAVAAAVSRRPGQTLLLTLASCVLCVAATLQFMKFETKRSDLIDPSAEFHRRWTKYTRAFGDGSDLVVVVEASDPDAIKRALEELGDRILAEPDRFTHVLYKVEPDGLRRKGLQYLGPEQLAVGLQQLKEFRPVLDGGWDRLRLDFLANGLRSQLRDRVAEVTELRAAANSSPVESPEAGDASTQTPAEVQQALFATERKLDGTLLHLRQLCRSIAAFSTRSVFLNPWPEVISIDPEMQSEGRDVVYLMNEAGTIGFLKARAVEAAGFDGPTPSIDRLRELIAITAGRHSAVRIGLTGIPVLENDEMRRSQSDMVRASILSFVGVGVLLLIGFRGWRHPGLAMAMLAVGMCWAFGFTTLVVGHLNILSVSFAAILIGLGIDFAIHYLAMYLDLRHHGKDLQAALEDCSSRVGVGIVTAAVTTSLAFFCASLTEFLGVAELGIIAGGGVLLCAAATFVVLPAMVTLADRRVAPQKLPTPFQGTALRHAIRCWPKLTMLLSLSVVAGLGVFGISIRNGRIESLVGYDYNLLHLQADGLDSVEVQRRIFHEAERQHRPGQGSLLFAVSIAKSPAEAIELRSKFEKLATVHHVEELASRLPAYPSSRTALLVQGYQTMLAHLPTEMPEPTGANPIFVGQTFEKLLTTLNEIDQPAARDTEESINQFLDALDPLEIEDQVTLLIEYQQRMAAALLVQFRTLRESADPEPVSINDLPSELTSRFVSPDGQWLVQVYPNEPVWDLEPLQHFVQELRTVDPEVTGTPLQNFEASRQIMNSYQNAAIYALAVVTFVLLIDFLGPRASLQAIIPSIVITGFIAISQFMVRGGLDASVLLAAFMSLVVSLALATRPGCVLSTIATLSPPIVGGLMMFGVLALLKVDFNPANLIVLPLILGIGVDDGVHVLHDFRTQSGDYEISASTINAIVLTSLTSMIGFGSMMIAAHRGLYSLGLVLVVGVGSCLFVSLVVLPALLTVARNRRPSQRVPPFQAD